MSLLHTYPAKKVTKLQESTSLVVACCCPCQVSGESAHFN